MKNLGKYYAKGDKRRKAFSSRRSCAGSILGGILSLGVTALVSGSAKSSSRSRYTYHGSSTRYSSQHEMALRRAERLREKEEKP